MYNSDYNQVHLNGNIIKVLWRQQQELLKKSPEYVKPIINNEDPLDIQIDLEGPKDTPYEGGIFRVKLIIPNGFPSVAPKGIFMTKIFHPNISEKGEICVNTLKNDWNGRQWSLYNLFEVIKCLLIVPFPQSALNEEAGKLFMENYDEYFKLAKMYTKIYAKKNNNNCNNNSNIDSDNGNNLKENQKKEVKNEDDIEMEDSTINNNIENCNCTQNDIRVNINMLEPIKKIDYRRMTEMPKTNYSLNYKNENNTKNSCYYQSNIKNNKFNDYINNFNNFNFNFMNNQPKNNAQNIQHLSSKEKPNLSLLPLMNTNQIKNNNNIFGYHRSNTFNSNIPQSNINGNNYNNSQDINKWLMRI